jgi:hypothetical protein
VPYHGGILYCITILYLLVPLARSLGFLSGAGGGGRSIPCALSTSPPLIPRLPAPTNTGIPTTVPPCANIPFTPPAYQPNRLQCEHDCSLPRSSSFSYLSPLFSYNRCRLCLCFARQSAYSTFLPHKRQLPSFIRGAGHFCASRVKSGGFQT